MLWEIKGLFYILKYDKNTFSTIFWNSSLEILDITPTLKVFSSTDWGKILPKFNFQNTPLVRQYEFLRQK